MAPGDSASNSQQQRAFQRRGPRQSAGRSRSVCSAASRRRLKNKDRKKSCIDVVAVPRRQLLGQVLAGLLTSELANPTFSSRRKSPLRQWSTSRIGFTSTSGHSGGAVPGFHRSSLLSAPQSPGTDHQQPRRAVYQAWKTASSPFDATAKHGDGVRIGSPSADPSGSLTVELDHHPTWHIALLKVSSISEFVMVSC